jgi:hypothetical protein
MPGMLALFLKGYMGEGRDVMTFANFGPVVLPFSAITHSGSCAVFTLK